MVHLLFTFYPSKWGVSVSLIQPACLAKFLELDLRGHRYTQFYLSAAFQITCCSASCLKEVGGVRSGVLPHFIETKLSKHFCHLLSTLVKYWLRKGVAAQGTGASGILDVFCCNVWCTNICWQDDCLCPPWHLISLGFGCTECLLCFWHFTPGSHWGRLSWAETWNLCHSLTGEWEAWWMRK